MRSRDSVEPILGDAIGPTGAQRATNVVVLGGVIVVLGLALAAIIGLGGLAIVTLFTSIGR
jgi:hypothetical protein